MSVSDLVDRQSELFGRISRAVENLRKLGETKITFGQVQSRLDTLKVNWEKFQATHEKLRSIKASCKQEQLEVMQKMHYLADDIFSQCEEYFTDNRGTMLDLLEVHKPAAASGRDANTSSTITASDSSRRLPRIDLPTFSGKYSEWKSFHDLFTSIVRENSCLSDVEKLHYLKSSLTGEPSQLIKNVAITGENLARAWETLVNRYENKRLLTENHLATLFAVPRLIKKSSVDLKRLHSDTNEALGALETLGCPVKHWDAIIVYMTVRKLDPGSLEEWEKEVSRRSEAPTFAELNTFLLGRIHTLEAVEQAHNHLAQNKSPAPHVRSNPSSTKSHTAVSKERTCSCCKGNHYIATCTSFREKSLEQRNDLVTSKQLCFNCLGNHQIKDCRSEKVCRTCNGKHHTLLHRTSSASTNNSTKREPGTQTETPKMQASSSSNTQVNSHCAQAETFRRSPVLLATVQLIASNPATGESITARALLDQGSESSFVTESLTQKLHLPRKNASIPVIGVGAQQSGVTRGMARIQLQSRVQPTFSCEVEALILPRLTAFLPSFRLLQKDWPHLQELNLADQTFAHPSQIDIILGADLYSQVIDQGIRRAGPGTPIAQETKFGWVLSGAVSSDATSVAHCAVQGFQGSVDNTLLDLMQRFWTQEEITKPFSLTSDDEQCEKQFRETVSRDSSGRYVVRLPLKDNSVKFGNSRTPAFLMLNRLEKRFATDTDLKTAYSSFLREYSDLNHMCRALPVPPDHARVFYLPHHAVLRESSSTTKVRVVFNGSQKTDLGLSLNDNLLVGPKVQTDLADVLLRWRSYPVAFSADLVKMYRQILIHEDDRDLQRILWRENPELPVEEYQLSTVTYGLASSPYLAIRVLHQLVEDEGKSFHLASQAILNNMYVDDILSGAQDSLQGREKINELVQLFKAGGFELQKWTSSHPDTLKDIAQSKLETAMHLNLDQAPFFRALGLAWRPDIDSFAFSPQLSQIQPSLTKRKVLSQTAQLFDPLGWLAPITVRAKIFMQELWSHGVSWDEPLSEEQKNRWQLFLHELQGLSSFTIPRWIGLSSATIGLEIHGFADASQDALGAVVYSRAYVDSHEVRVSIVCAKTKVAPVKKVTIPRLELCAALLLVRAVRHVQQTLNLENVPIHLWTDSTVALAWIKSHPSRWKEFVRNRVTDIQELKQARWHHVSGSENPADLASRDASPAQLQNTQLWTLGPSWLSKPSVSWPNAPAPLNDEDLQREERKQVLAHHDSHQSVWDLVDRYSVLSKLLKITALCIRAAALFKSKGARNSSVTFKPANSVTTQELEDACLFWIRTIQRAYFSEEIKQLKTSSNRTRNKTLLRLAPFLDPEGLLRVGGRLRHSQLSYDEKHPFILPRKSSFTTLIIDHYHQKTLHGGPQLTLASARQRYWILGGRVPIRAFIHRCIRCVRQRATLSVQQMGQLPSARVTPTIRPFLQSGVDYAGPIAVRASRLRNAKTFKSYIVIFVCLATSAVHLELVSDYTSEAFIAAYKRFTARRGICASISSDCGTNLAGADAELRRLLSESSKEFSQVADTLASLGTQWRFNPPSAPHFGGKWEAGVKSVKFHLKRVIGEAKLTFEQYSTFLTQVEATLNSRPLCALSDDSTDLMAMTPGHFLIGAALNTVPEPSLANLPTQRLSHWQHSRQMLEHFWKRWSSEYLQTFQNLSKWQTKQENIKPGSIVLIKDENLPPSLWLLARILEVHPGNDGLVRVVTLKTKSSILKRPVAKLCLLPIFPESELPTAGGNA